MIPRSHIQGFLGLGCTPSLEMGWSLPRDPHGWLRKRTWALGECGLFIAGNGIYSKKPPRKKSLVSLIHNKSLTFGKGKLFQMPFTSWKPRSSMHWLLLPLIFPPTQRKGGTLRKQGEIIPGDKTQTAQMAQTQWEEAHGGRLAWKSTIAPEFINALSRKKKFKS